MEKTNKKDDMSTWPVGGGLLMGIGVGFFFLKESALYFTGCTIIGLGLGLVIATLVSRRKEQK